MFNQPHSRIDRNLRCRQGVCFDNNFYIFSMKFKSVEFSTTKRDLNSMFLMRSLILPGIQLKIKNSYFNSFSIGRSDYMR